MGEVVDEVVLHPVKLDGFMQENKNDRYSREDDAEKKGKYQNNDPALGRHCLGRIDAEPVYNRFEHITDPDVPVDIEKKAAPQCKYGKNQHQYGM